ncbi:MAG TPA: M28 family peptidase [Longimicrobium sp.]|nr:M28 family peptidase [Longimicrobium sp.]
MTAPLRPTLRASLSAALALGALAGAPDGARAQGAPRYHAPTGGPIAPADLSARLHALAHDTMLGRAAGTEANVKATDYIAAEFRRAGLEPAGVDGTFFQPIDLVVTGLQPGAALSADGQALRLWADFAPVAPVEGVFRFGAGLRAEGGVPVVFGGRIGGETIAPAQAAGKLVVLLPAAGAEEYRFWRHPAMPWYPEAAGVAVASLESTPANILEFFQEEQKELAEGERTEPTGAGGIVITRAAAARLLGADPASLRPGAAGKSVRGGFRFGTRPAPVPARNVVAVLRGSDPALRGQYVVVGAHNDHEPPLSRALDHDSVRAFNRVMRPQGANDPVTVPTPQQAARIAALRDSMRAARGGVKMDSIMNGADDDGSGTVTLIEIAEWLASRPQRPKRSVLFVSHTAEEIGLYGSRFFTDHPTVPRDSIVAALNMDMVGRGRAEEVKGGGPRYIQIIGSRRLSTQLGDLVDAVNGRRAEPMDIDYSWDAPGHPLNRYCRSDHFSYARYGIPITYFSLGYHVDYHQVGDEPQYIDYDHMARVATFVGDVAAAIADRPERLVVDKPKPDPNAPCRQ